MDVVAVPDGVEADVCEAHHEHVHNELLAEVVVDAVHLRLGQRTAHVVAQVRAALRVLPKGLL